MNAFKRSRQIVDHYPNRTLVIVDMQDDFIGDDELDLVPIICKLIQYARHEEWSIIVVEFANRGHTNIEITDALKGYPHQKTVVKEKSNGGREIIECINSKKTWSLDLLVCGVYGDECVTETVTGLFCHSDLVEVDVIIDAVHPPYCSLSEKDEFDEQREIEVVMEDVLNCNLIM